MSDVSDLPNLGPRSAQMLARAGITSLAQLQVLEDHQRGSSG